MKLKIRIEVQCNECGKKFSTAKLHPQCPKCSGSDIDPVI